MAFTRRSLLKTITSALAGGLVLDIIPQPVVQGLENLLGLDVGVAEV